MFPVGFLISKEINSQYNKTNNIFRVGKTHVSFNNERSFCLKLYFFSLYNRTLINLSQQKKQKKTRTTKGKHEIKRKFQTLIIAHKILNY